MDPGLCPGSGLFAGNKMDGQCVKFFRTGGATRRVWRRSTFDFLRLASAFAPTHLDLAAAMGQRVNLFIPPKTEATGMRIVFI